MCVVFYERAYNYFAIVNNSVYILQLATYMDLD